MDDFRNFIDGPGPLGRSGTAGNTLYGALDFAGDIDVVQTYLIAGLTYDFWLNFGFGSTVETPKLELFDRAGVRLAESLGSNPVFHDTGFSFTAAATGAHFLFARSEGTQFDAYDLLVERGVATDGDEAITASPLSDGIDARGGDDVIRGGAGEDSLLAGAGDDVLYGGDGNDYLGNTSGTDALYGGDGADRLAGSGDSWNKLYGGAGDDAFYLSGDGWYPDDTFTTINTVYGGSGSDTVHLSLLEPSPGRDPLIDLVAQTIRFSVAGWPEQTLVSIENAWGSDADDSMIGTRDANMLNGGYGADTLFGRGGADSLYGGDSGDDLIYGGDGDDLVDAGLDIYAINDSDRLFGGDGADVLAGRYFEDTLDGGAGDDTLYGGHLPGSLVGDDELDGDDSLYGGAGADRLYGGHGDDALTGGSGSDAYFGGVGSDTVLFAGVMTDMQVDLSIGRASILGRTFESLISIENVRTGSGNDTLLGSADANALRGGDGVDHLTGGDGADTLIGGTGGDFFVFVAAGDSRNGLSDRIVAGDRAAAFENAGDVGGDAIDLTAIDAISGGTDDAFKFGTDTGAGRLWVTEVGSNTHVRANLDISAAFEFEVIIADGANRASEYSAADFVL